MKKHPKILMVGPVPPPYGGQSVLLEGILQSRLTEMFSILPFNVTHLRPGRMERFFLSVAFIKRLVALLISRPTVRLLHVHTSAGFAFFEKSLFSCIGRIFGKRILMHIHGGKFVGFWTSSDSWKRRLISMLLDVNDELIVLSPSSRTFYRQTIGVRKPVHILPNAVRAENGEKAYGKGDPVVFLFVGNLRPEKGLVDILEALRLLPKSAKGSITLRIMGAGDTPYNEKLVRNLFSAEAFPNVTFVGFKSGDEKWREYRDADVFLLPSHSEDMPISILEGMACGLPVISTTVGAIPEVVIEGENGFLIPPRAPSLLADRIVCMAEDRELRLRMGSINRQKALREFSFTTYEHRLEEIYKSLLD